MPRTTATIGQRVVGFLQPLEALVQRVAVGEGVQRRNPVAELIGGAEACDPQRRGIGTAPCVRDRSARRPLRIAVFKRAR